MAWNKARWASISADFDNDGWLDLYTPTPLSSNTLLLNNPRRYVQ